MSRGSDSRPAVLVIAGSDSSGGAGLIRDVQVLTHFGCDALCAVTAVTAQTDTRVTAVHPVPPETVRAQIAAALANRRIAAVKIGMLGTREIVKAVVDSLRHMNAAAPIVLDPVLLSSSGGVLLDAAGREVLREQLMPRATVATPNTNEAAALLDEAPAIDESALSAQAQRLLAFGPRWILLKGGHASGPDAVDLLVAAGGVTRIVGPRLDATQRGTGCALASAIAAHLAFGEPMESACRKAKEYVSAQLRAAKG
ncbi:MAG TPA: bifunctional hydroxymethylpyrimidine kinase/phosphomethylpyrimidine kinase [Steroidobacteraceae bacterium]|nr:bifunctional hydroxymethylpyrimidine kinase/phosphomethylpyrimidine kinase [Steroidobacteraceae bacterium]